MFLKDSWLNRFRELLNASDRGRAAEKVPVRTLETANEEDRERVGDLVIANRILAEQGVLDGYGHVSVRSAKNPLHYYISCSRAPALVSADDIMKFDLEDNAIDPRGRTSYGERFIHSEIYKARPDVMAVVHSHSPAVIPFGVTDMPLRPVSHMAGFLTKVPVWEIREVAGENSNMLVINKSLGAALASKLGDNTVVLMRGHGDTVVGSSLKTAVAHAIYAEFNARIQTNALALSDNVTFLNDMEAANVAAFNDRSVERPWEVWKAQALSRSKQME
jgi:ribulose-5-phosphate 4-epimerase/fuculose-1-phosphate aldolase